MNKNIRQMHFAKMVDGKCVEYKPSKTVSEDGLTVTITYKSLEDMQKDGFKELVMKFAKAPSKTAKLTFEYEETETQIIKKTVWTEKNS